MFSLTVMESSLDISKRVVVTPMRNITKEILMTDVSLELKI
jgi:hypothetical protein